MKEWNFRVLPEAEEDHWFVGLMNYLAKITWLYQFG